jgi:hypothetical protein
MTEYGPVTAVARQTEHAAPAGPVNWSVALAGPRVIFVIVITTGTVK